MSLSIADLRRSYSLQQLNESEVNPDPIQQFQVWFDQAVAAQLPEPNAMTLATASRDGIPSARIVLLKGVDQRGFVFYSNYESAKGKDLAENPQAALVFLWTVLERQVRIAGTVEKVSDQETAAYFHSRPLESRLGAWASEQSSVIPSREVLEQRFQQLQRKYQNQEIPRPPHWGGLSGHSQSH
ncbi:pyridoxamine 5'-phosphate oxidase [Kovacikia minuta]|uniref:pyridoxamine 5'-phosphate oxidase n=1 Tax=Kovacikia minuta TaxID=2931930 RepID=UPI002676315F